MKYDCICTQGSHKEGDKCVQGSQVPKTLNCRVVQTVDSHEKFMSTFCHILPMGVVAMEQTSRLASSRRGEQVQISAPLHKVS